MRQKEVQEALDTLVSDSVLSNKEVYLIKYKNNVYFNRVVITKGSKFITYYQVKNSVYTFETINFQNAKVEYDTLIYIHNIINNFNDNNTIPKNTIMALIEYKLSTLKTIDIKNYIIVSNIITLCEREHINKNYINTIKHRFNYYKFN